MKHTIPGLFLELKGQVIDGMLAYLEDGEDEAGYTRADIDRCDAILTDYLEAVFEPGIHGDDDAIMAAVETAVLALNALNEACDQSLLETDQREGICEIIIHAAADAGLDADGEDITEAWREW